ncbi:MAG: hypothetical protein JNK05_30765 [Myxococcales bacterium]|nr:hypothetical protein [Myxococcales bacterium]
MLFCFDPQWMFGADGVEMLAYRTPDEEPTWRFAARSPIAGVALASGNAIAVAADGTVGWFDASNGRLRSSANARPSPLDLAADAWGGVAVVYADAIALFDSAGARSLAAPPGAALTTAAFAGQSRLIAAGTTTGQVLLFDAASGQYGGAVSVSDKPIASLTGVAHGRWLATAGDSVYDVTLTSAARFTGATGETLGYVVFDANTQCFGLQIAPNAAVFMDFRSKDTRMSVTYPERLIRGLGVVGPHGYAVGLDLGDANRFDLQRQTCRTEPHPGRPRNRWVLMVGR